MKITYMILDFLWRTPLSGVLKRLSFTKCEKQPRTGEMILEGCGSGCIVKHHGCYMTASEKIRWVSRERDAKGAPLEVREPIEHTESFPDDDFFAAGKHYSNIRQLFVKMSKDSYWCRDIYDREVFYAAERFPSFDCFDSMYDERCYRWFFLREGDRLTRVFYADGSGEVHVTEDVENMENYCWEEMLEQGCFSAEEERNEH